MKKKYPILIIWICVIFIIHPINFSYAQGNIDYPEIMNIEQENIENPDELTAYDLYEDGSGKNIVSDEAVKKEKNSDEDAYLMSSASYQISQAGVNMIKSFEGFRKEAYKALSTEQYYTIGYGHYGSDVYEGMVITEEQGEEMLRNDLVRYVGYVNSFLGKYDISVTQNQFDALVSFTYNVGNVWVSYDTFQLKTILINGVSNYTDSEITTAFTNWNKSGGNVIDGLTNRRRKEAAYFLDGRSIDFDYRQNVSNSAVNCNASAGNLPSEISSVDKGESAYFNVQVYKDTDLKQAALYIKRPGDSSFSNVDTETASSLLRYAYFEVNVGNTSGKLEYYWILTTTGGTKQQTNTGNISINGQDFSYRQNISNSAASCNASNGDLPSGISSVDAGKSVYFNVQVYKDTDLKQAALYIKRPGNSSFSNVDTENASLLRYAFFSENVGNVGGTLQYYWILTTTGGQKLQTSTGSISVKSNTYTNSIALWANGFKYQEGTNDWNGNNAYLLGTTTFTKTEKESYSFTEAMNKTVIPNGFSLKNTWGSSGFTSDGSWKTYSFSDTVTQPAKDVGIQYYCDPIEYKITYNLNGGDNHEDNPATYSVLYGVTLNNPTRGGYIFTGWTDSNGNKITGINEGANATFNSASDLYDKLKSRTTGNLSVTANWESQEVKVTSITIDKETIQLETGKSRTLTATVKPDNATDKTVTWTSTDESIATVKDGVVAGVKAGTTTITAQAGEKTAVCEVTITNPQEPTGEGLYLSLESVTHVLKPGDQIDVYINATQNPGYAVGGAVLSWDNQAFELVDVVYDEKAPAFNAESIEDNGNRGSYTISFGDDQAKENFTGTGTFFTVSFRILDGAEAKEYPITLKPSDGDLLNVDFEEVSMETSDGSITLTNTLIGDVNGDGKVNRADAGILNRYFAGWQGYEEKIVNRDAADVNRDGKLNRADAGIMNRYFAGWQGYDQYFQQ